MRDSITGAPAAFAASLVVTNHAIYDSSEFLNAVYDTSSILSLESAPSGVGGDYTVRVRKAGYRLWQQAGVLVNGDACGADAVTLDVRLQPGP